MNKLFLGIAVFAALSASAMTPKAADEGTYANKRNTTTTVPSRLQSAGAGHGIIPIEWRTRSTEPRSWQLYRPAGIASATSRQVMANAPGIRYPELIGSVIYSSAWTSSYAAPGVYIIPTSADGTFEQKISENTPAKGGGVRVGQYYYTVEYRQSYGEYYVYINKYDINTWQSVKYWTVTPQFISPGGMALDPTTGIVYGIFYTEDLKGCTLSTISFEENAPVMETICSIPSDIDVVALSCDASGQLYAITRTVEIGINDYTVVQSSLAKMDKHTGALSTIGETGMYPYYTSAATIDLKSGRMFWTVSPKDNTGHLCEVDLNTGVASLICTYPNGEEICGLFVADPLAEDGAPDRVSNIELSFPEGTLSGNVSFDTPGCTFDGNEATGPVDYSITVNGAAPITGTTSYSTRAVVPVTVPAPGNYTFRIALKSDAGSSPVEEVTSYIGVGVPKTPKPTMSTADGVVTLTWDPVSEVIDKGYINPAEVTYTVTRYPDETVVADNIKDTKYTGQLPATEDLTYYYFTVQAFYGGAESAIAETDKIMVGSIGVPYTYVFNNSDALNGYTVIDANRDNKTWQMYAGDCAAAWYNSTEAMDDWLITPPMRLNAGLVYPLSVETSCADNTTSERIEVKAGTKPTVEAMTISVLDPTVITGTAITTLSGFITVETSGTYRIGFHGISDRDQYLLKIHNYTISEGVAVPIPTAPVVNAVAAADGSGTVSLSITAPLVDLTGNDLSAITKIELMRDGRLIETFDNPVPGSKLTYTDQNVSEGSREYSAVAYAGQYKSPAGTATAFVGNDVPSVPAGVTISETSNPGEITLTWDAVTTDVNGKPIKGDVTYAVYTFAENGSHIKVKDGIAGTTYTFVAVEEGQEFVQCGVTAITDKGEGSGGLSDAIAAGQPYQAPWTEAFKEETVGIFALADITGNAEVGLMYDDYLDVPSQDGDGMYLGFMGDRGDMAMIVTGKIDLNGLTDPGLTAFAYTFGNDDDNVLEIYAGEANCRPELIKRVTMKDLGDRGWQMVSVDLKKYAGKVIQIALSYNFGTYNTAMIDNLRVRSMVDCDLATYAFECPLKATPAREFAVKVGVHNDGLKTASDYTVTLFIDGEEHITLPGKELKADERDMLTFKPKLHALTTEPAEIYAVINASGDANTDNNATERVSVKPILSTLPPVTALRGEATANGALLSWDEPNTEPLTPAKETIDFEDEVSFSHSIDNWMFVDVDRQPAGSFNRFDIPGIINGVTLTSFFVFDNSLPQFNETFTTHSGTKCLATMWRHDEKQTDDWLITPMLSGDAQTVSFYARSYNFSFAERFTILYSTTDTEINSFHEIDYIDKVPESWTQYQANVPEGTKYLAIRSSNSGGYMLFIDDFEFVPAPEFSEFSLTGYNVYADNTLVDTTEDNEYLHAETSGIHSYAVTAVYDMGESRSSNVVVLEGAGIENPNGNDVVITAIDGVIRIAGADGLAIAICATDGRSVFAGTGSVLTTVPTGKGLFIVTVNGQSAKILVK